MRKALLATICLAVLGLAATEAHAQIRFGGQASYGDDVDLGIGARVMFGLRSISERLEGIASFDWFFPGDLGGIDWTCFEVNANAAYSIPLSGSAPLRPYVGGGLNVARTSIDLPDVPFFSGAVSGTEVGLNILGGSKFGSGGLTPFAELRFELGGGEQFVVSGGILF